MRGMDELVAWLTGVLDDLERVARDAAEVTDPSGEWRGGPTKIAYFDRDDDNYSTLTTSQAAHGRAVAHIAVHDPRSVLARVETERAIVAELGRMLMCASPSLGNDWSFIQQVEHDRELAEQFVRLLAHGHRFDAPGWRDEWAPEGVAAAAGG